LSLEIRTVLRITPLIVDEAVPDVDISDSGFIGSRAIKLIEITHVACRFGATDRRQSHPYDRYAPRLERRDHVVDALGIKLGAFVGMKFIACARRRMLRGGRGGRGMFTVGWCRTWFCRRWTVAQRRAVIYSEHHNDGVGFLARRQQVLDGLRPFRCVQARIVANQT